MPRALLALAGLLTVTPVTGGAQGAIASRVTQVRDGVVRMEYETRAGVCGDGRDNIGFRHAYFGGSFESWGGWSDKRCVPGDARVTLSIDGGEITRVRTQVGGTWPVTDARVTDLGTVSPHEAAAYFLSIVPALESESRSARTIFPAVIADDDAVIAPLTRLANDSQRTIDTRRQSVHWLGLLGDKSVVPTLVGLARQGSEGESEKRSLRSAATFALAFLDAGAGVAPLLELSHDASPSLRKATVSALAETDDPRAFRRLRQMLDDTNEPGDLRKDALFWLGQRASYATADIVAFYRATDDAGLREHAIFVLSQRQDDAAVDALIRIAKEDGDKRMRGKALFWLAQKQDPRVMKLISDILAR